MRSIAEQSKPIVLRYTVLRAVGTHGRDRAANSLVRCEPIVM